MSGILCDSDDKVHNVLAHSAGVYNAVEGISKFAKDCCCGKDGVTINLLLVAPKIAARIIRRKLMKAMEKCPGLKLNIMKLTDCFDRVHVINLPYKVERRERLSAHLREVGIADPDKIHWERAISGDRCWAPAYFLAGNGPWGCLQSHIRIVQDAIMDGIGSYLVLEDDAVFHRRAPEMLERLMGER